MTERRKAERLQASGAAAVQARFGRGIECTVRNVSRDGACLVFVHRQTALPKEFSLTLARESASRPCRIVWQSSYRVGVQFVGEC